MMHGCMVHHYMHSKDLPVLPIMAIGQITHIDYTSYLRHTWPAKV